MVSIKLHGELGKAMRRSDWHLDVKSVSEGIHAVNVISKNRLYKFLYEKEKGQAKYQILVNKRPFYSERPITEQNIEDLANSELVMNIHNLKTIDIVPVISGSKDVIGIILGVVLIVAGLFTFGTSAVLGAALIVGGIGLLAAGIINLLSSPPKFEDFREIDGSTGRTSYLFNGPENTTREGGPVPVGYGQLVVGSQVISASYVVDYESAGIDVPNDDGNLDKTRTEVVGTYKNTNVYQDNSNGKFFIIIPSTLTHGELGPVADYPTSFLGFRSYSAFGTVNGPFYSQIVPTPNKVLPTLVPFGFEKGRFFSFATAFYSEKYDSANPNVENTLFMVVKSKSIQGFETVVYNRYAYLIPTSLVLPTKTSDIMNLFPKESTYQPLKF